MSKCPVCGLDLADPPKGGKCDPRAAAMPIVATPPAANTEPAPKPAFWYHAPGPAWSPNG